MLKVSVPCLTTFPFLGVLRSRVTVLTVSVARSMTAPTFIWQKPKKPCSVFWCFFWSKTRNTKMSSLSAPIAKLSSQRGWIVLGTALVRPSSSLLLVTVTKGSGELVARPLYRPSAATIVRCRFAFPGAFILDTDTRQNHLHS